ncbi:MAG: molybdopterin-dependent oxidoreductase [Candidatus Korarchaeum sp.]|nr:molybdopterin-dependent oxidoreductase [Candidatus Korarchaeum sp.]
MRRIICQRDCPDACSLIVGNDNLRGDPDHPVTRGFACQKASRFLEYYRSSKRVLYPHVRVGDGYERVSWDEALDLVADELKRVLDSYGPEEVLVYDYAGSTGLVDRKYPKRLFNAIGATSLRYTLCDEAGEEAIELHYGSSYGAFPEDMEEASLLVIWGADLSATSVHAYKTVVDLRAAGKEVWVIDPRVTKVARLGRHLRPKPGTDGLLAVGISWYIINEFEVDSEFIREFTKGFDEYERLISSYPLDLIEKVTSVRRERMRELAESYSKLKPSVTYIGKGVQKAKYGAEAVRLISLIPALVGIHRGFFYSNSSRDFDEHLATQHPGSGRKVNMIDLPKLLTEGKFRFIYIYNSNPALTLPRAKLFRKGMERTDLFKVVHEVVWSETAKLADVVLPATSMFEHDDLVASWWHRYVGYSRKAFEPLGESKPNWWVTRELSKRLGIRKPELEEDPLEAIRKALSKSKMVRSYEELLSKPYVELIYPSKDTYQTPSGKIEFYSEIASKRGYSPLPRVTWEEVKSDYPYRLLTSAVPWATSSQDTIQDSTEDFLHMSEDDCIELGLEDGGLIALESDSGERITVKVKVDRNLPKGILWARRSAFMLNSIINDLITDEKQEISGGNCINSTFVRLVGVK